MIDFAYSRLGLRYNPFGELDRQQRIDTAVPRCDFRSVTAFLGSEPVSHRAVQFIGPPGSGKSTHLLMLASALPDFYYVHLPRNTRRLVPARQHLMIDEAQRLGWRQRRRLFHAAHSVVLGTHRCFARGLRKLGFEVITVSLTAAPEIDWLANVLEQKIRAAQRSENPDRQAGLIDEGAVVQLRDEFGNNIRGMERRLYETLHALNSADEVAGVAN